MDAINERCKESGFFVSPVHVDFQMLTERGIKVIWRH